MSLFFDFEPQLYLPVCHGCSQQVSSSFGVAPKLFETDASSTYHSLQVELQKRYGARLQFSSAFTYSHAIDNASDFFDNAGSFSLPQNSVQPSERGSSNFDVRLRSVTNAIWDLPFMRSSLWGGFSLSGIFTAQTGEPFAINTSIDMNADGNLTDRLDNTQGLILNPVPSDKSRVLQLAPNTVPIDLLPEESVVTSSDQVMRNGRMGRNTFRSRGLAEMDLALSKTTRLFGEHALIVRFEVYNLFNHPNFGIPVRILEEPGFGPLVRTITSARTLQLAIKYSF